MCMDYRGTIQSRKIEREKEWRDGWIADDCRMTEYAGLQIATTLHRVVAGSVAFLQFLAWSLRKSHPQFSPGAHKIVMKCSQARILASFATSGMPSVNAMAPIAGMLPLEAGWSARQSRLSV